jgi:hypothetical protein
MVKKLIGYGAVNGRFETVKNNIWSVESSNLATALKNVDNVDLCGNDIVIQGYRSIAN